MSAVLALPLVVLVLGSIAVAALARRVRAEVAAVDRGIEQLGRLGQALDALAAAAASTGAAQDRVLRPERHR